MKFNHMKPNNYVHNAVISMSERVSDDKFLYIKSEGFQEM